MLPFMVITVTFPSSASPLLFLCQPTILEAFSPPVSAALPREPAPVIDQAKDWDQLKVFYPALKVDRRRRTQLGKCHFNCKFMNV